ncbi:MULTISPECIES: hypothetical protein [Micromonospora]|uniref:Transcriptional regulator n=1 Tax=Micromonospora solifontis TaxID=2487138 RepID=A0ABX9WH88_9ACTN|nr:MULTISPECIES: hypothetical protein [Micromonospora]NES13950.1 hypothetical protein [Micromonospora sp. PPF5-17B]NES37491.1 hypothetical protein [Micromonospora solifontis]NES54050.1 hypothetical protein [Micromonospora sp. PPF5-6]RNL98298.1 hypothetical protein EFE23_15190 [Micromonospora solifontis]
MSPHDRRLALTRPDTLDTRVARVELASAYGDLGRERDRVSLLEPVILAYVAAGRTDDAIAVAARYPMPGGPEPA